MHEAFKRSLIPLKNWLFLGSSGERALRRHERHTCKSTGTLHILNSAHYLDGLVTEVSQSGLRFRPAKMFLLDRNGSQISCQFAGFNLTGKIVATRQDGYGVALHHELDNGDLDAFLAQQQEIGVMEQAQAGS